MIAHALGAKVKGALPQLHPGSTGVCLSGQVPGPWQTLLSLHPQPGGVWRGRELARTVSGAALHSGTGGDLPGSHRGRDI